MASSSETRNDSPPLALDLERANFRLLVMDIIWFGVGFPAVSRFLSVYAIRVGADAALLGWLSALPAIIALFTSSLAGWWRQFFSSTPRAQFWPGMGFRLLFLLPAFTPFFPHDWQPFWLLLSVVVPAIPQGVSSVLFLVVMREGVSAQTLVALTSRRALAFNVTVALSTLGLGFWLEQTAFPANYQAMYIMAFIVSMISLWQVRQVVPLTSEPPRADRQSTFRPWRSPAFQVVVFITVVTHIAFFSIIAIIPLRLVDELGADEWYMSIFSLAELGAAALLSWLTDPLVRRIGARPAIAVGMFGTGLAGLTLGLTSDLTLALIAAALSGGLWTLASISVFNFFSQNTPDDEATRCSTIFNQVVMLSIFIGPILGSQLPGLGLELTTVLLIGAALRLLASGLVFVNFGPRRAQNLEK